MDRTACLHVPRSPRRCRVRPCAALILLGGLAIVLLVLAPTAGAGPRQIISDAAATPSWWAGVHGSGAGSDGAADVVMLKGNVTLVAGTLFNAAGSDDISLTKYLGSVKQWTRSWDGPAHSWDVAAGLVTSRDGRWVYVAGQSLNAAGNQDIVVLKRSVSTGGLQWVRRYDGPAHKTDFAVAVGLDKAGNVVVAGNSQNTSDLDWAVVSWSASGARRWSWRYDGAHGADTLVDAVVAGDGTVCVTGFGVVAGPKQASVTARLSSSGARKWLKKYLGPSGIGAASLGAVARPGGGVYVCGHMSSPATGADGMILGYTAGGGRKLFVPDTAGGGPTNEAFRAVGVTTTKSLVAAGLTEVGGLHDGRIVTYRPDGSIIVGGTFAGPWSDTFSEVATDGYGGWCVAGTHHVAATIARISVWRGSMLEGGGAWHSLFGSTPSEHYYPAAIATRNTSICVVGTYDAGLLSGLDQAVLMFNY